jgi:hypothetical protein
MHRFASQIADYRLSRTIGAAPAENNCDFSKAQGTGLAIFAGPRALSVLIESEPGSNLLF